MRDADEAGERCPEVKRFDNSDLASDWLEANGFEGLVENEILFFREEITGAKADIAISPGGATYLRLQGWI